MTSLLARVSCVSVDFWTLCEVSSETDNHLLYERFCNNQFWRDFEKFWFLLSSKHINHKRYISSNVFGALAALFFTHHYLQLEIECKRTVGCNLTPVIGQLKQPITDLITITIALNTYPEKKLGNFQNGGIFHFRQFLFQRCLSLMHWLFFWKL